MIRHIRISKFFEKRQGISVVQKIALVAIATACNILIGCNLNATSPIYFSKSSIDITEQEFRVSLEAPDLKRADAKFSRFGVVDEKLIERGEWISKDDAFRFAYLELSEYNGSGYYLTETSLNHTFQRSMTAFVTQVDAVSKDRIVKTGRGITRYKTFTYASRDCFGFQRYYTTNRGTPDHVAGDARFFGYYCSQKNTKLTDAVVKEIILSFKIKGNIVR